MADYKDKEHVLRAGEQEISAAEPDAHNDEQKEQHAADAAIRDLMENENSANTAAQGIPDILPVLPVRDVVIFNYMILPLFIGREKPCRRWSRH